MNSSRKNYARRPSYLTRPGHFRDAYSMAASEQYASAGRHRPPISRRLTMVGDPFTNKKTVRLVAIVDLGLAGLLLLFAAYRLVANDFRAQSLIVFIGAKESVIVAILYWLSVFSLIGLQLVIAFLLLASTKDMTTDPETMMKKCLFWRTFSVILLILLSLDLIISFYLLLSEGAPENRVQRLASVILDTAEIIFRGLGIYFVGKFLDDLHSVFVHPISQSNVSSPAMGRSSRTPSMVSTHGAGGYGGPHSHGNAATPNSLSTMSAIVVPGVGGGAPPMPMPHTHHTHYQPHRPLQQQHQQQQPQPPPRNLSRV